MKDFTFYIGDSKVIIKAINEKNANRKFQNKLKQVLPLMAKGGEAYPKLPAAFIPGSRKLYESGKIKQPRAAIQ